MIILLSPAKSLNQDCKFLSSASTQCNFLDQSQQLVDILKKMPQDELKALMGVSDNIAELNFQRYQDWSCQMTEQNSYQSIFFFRGDVYQGLDAQTLNEGEINFLQKHLRILSGLYGFLRPLDLIKAYRLEMGTSLVNAKGNNLYQFWQETLTKHLMKEKPKFVLNLASNEYSKSVKLKDFSAPVITPVFKDWKLDKYKVVSFWAKRARGLMTRFIAQNKITDISKLKNFASQGYYFSEKDSNKSELVFLRDH